MPYNRGQQSSKTKDSKGQPTAIYKQWLALKADYPDMILFFRLGDFYETFETDAFIVSSELDVVLTSREMLIGSPDRTPMAGVPYRAAENYIARLIAKGYKVAVTDQVETSNKELRERKISRVITPGTVVEPGMLSETRNNYLAAVLLDGEKAGLAYVDITTGEFHTTQIEGADTLLRLRQELDRIGAAEVLVPAAINPRTTRPASTAEMRRWSSEGANDAVASPTQADIAPPSDITTAAQSPHPLVYWGLERARALLLQHFGTPTLEPFGCAKLPLAIRAAGAVAAYLRDTNPTALAQISKLTTYSVENFMNLDPQTRRNLELVERNGERAFTLISVLGREVKTAMGARLLTRWLSQPLIDLNRLRARQDAVSALVEAHGKRAEILQTLSSISDIERITNRIAQNIALPRELVALSLSLLKVPRLKELFGATRPTATSPADEDETGTPILPATVSGERKRDAIFGALTARLTDCTDICQLVESAIYRNEAGEAVTVLGKGKAIAPGYDRDYDEARYILDNAEEILAKMQERERERTGIKTLKISNNSVFGYYIEIGHGSNNNSKIPTDYVQKQTLVNANRYVTPALKELENQILTAQDRLVEIERKAFFRILKAITEQADQLMATANAIAHIAVFAGLAETAVANNYACPTLDEGERIEIVAGRHPVVELALRGEPFVPNDLSLSADEEQLLLITGPNMAGKSTYLRQVALITLMAQIGSWVPAQRAQIGLVDRIFTRIGAQDDLATGQSTFMVEMVETANILNHATRRSLIILDEIGRGTSTYDGLAIARAIVEYLHNSPRLGAKTLFATHYHELTELEKLLPRVRNYNVAVAEEGDHVIFLRQIVRGGADRSYGIHVAEMAGLPRSVIRRANEVLTELERSGGKEERRGAMTRLNQVGSNQMLMFGSGNGSAVIAPPALEVEVAAANPALEALASELTSMRVDEMSPIEAMTRLYELQRKAREASKEA